MSLSLLTLSCRYLRSRRVALVAVFSITLGVTAMIVVTSIMDGVQRFIQGHFRGTNGDLTIEHLGAQRGLVFHWDTVRLALSDHMVTSGGEIKALAPRVTVPGLVIPGERPDPRAEDRIRGVQVFGVDWFLEREVTPLDDMTARVDDENLRVPKGQIDPLAPVDGIPGLVMGDSLAKDLGLRRIGETLTVLTPEMLEQQDQAHPRRSRRFRLAGCFATGREDYDRLVVYADRAALQGVRFERPEVQLDATSVHGRVVNPDRASALAREIQESHPELECASWFDAHRVEILAIRDQKRIIVIILSSMIAIASAAIFGIVYLMVVEKTRDIGILRSLGLGRARLVAVFTVYGLVLGAIGSALGVFIGLQLVHSIDSVRDFLSRVVGKEVLAAEIYHFRRVPVYTEWSSVAWIVCVALGMSLIAALIPAWIRVQRWSPVRCLREE